MQLDHLKVTVKFNSLLLSRMKVARLFGIQVLMFLVRHLRLNLEFSYATVHQPVKDSSTILTPAKIFSKTNTIRILKSAPKRLLQRARLSTDSCLLSKKLYSYLETILLRYH
jgi:hypothetical protein